MAEAAGLIVFTLLVMAVLIGTKLDRIERLMKDLENTKREQAKQREEEEKDRQAATIKARIDKEIARRRWRDAL